MSTKAQLRTQIKQEARIKTGTNLDTLVDAIVADILRDLGNSTRHPELLIIDEELTAVDATATYALPADFQNLLAVRYGIGPNATYFRTLTEQLQRVNQSNAIGYPKWYRITSGLSLTFFPYENILATDSIFIDYYCDPNGLYILESAPFPVPRLESTVKKKAIARLQRFHASNQESQLMRQDAQDSFISSESST